MDNTKTEVAPDHYVIPAADYHAVVDAIRVEGESLVSHQPGSAGCVIAGRKLIEVADRLQATAAPAYDAEDDAAAAGDAASEAASDAPTTDASAAKATK